MQNQAAIVARQKTQLPFKDFTDRLLSSFVYKKLFSFCRIVAGHIAKMGQVLLDFYLPY